MNQEARKYEIIETGDGSKSIYLAGLDETYHSRHGAGRESLHVFIHAGLKKFVGNPNTIRILEVGFGTGLNALLTLQFGELNGLRLDYTALEPFPLPANVVDLMDYHRLDVRYGLLHKENVYRTGDFSLRVINKKLMEFQDYSGFDLVYYNAFGPRVQPEMWEPEVFSRLNELMNANSVLVTYCAKGSVRRAMIEAGYKVERLPGPPGKREMLRATKVLADE